MGYKYLCLPSVGMDFSSSFHVISSGCSINRSGYAIWRVWVLHVTQFQQRDFWITCKVVIRA